MIRMKRIMLQVKRVTKKDEKDEKENGDEDVKMDES